MDAPRPAQDPEFLVNKTRVRLLGLSFDDAVKIFFGGNAFISVVVLTLITYFLFQEGFGFFGQNHRSLLTYRQAGLEYVDYIRAQESGHTALNRYLADLRLRQFNELVSVRKLDLETANVGKTAEAAAVKIDTIDFQAELKVLTDTLPLYRTANAEFSTKLMASLDKAPQMPTPELKARLDRLRQLTKDYLATFPATQRLLETWDYTRPIPWYQSGISFITGKQWLTASFWQDFYGIVPLFIGSLMVSLVALAIAVPFGVGAAIYINQMASAREQRIVKPCIEFISAFPSVVLGFFGIAVLGQALRLLSQQEWLAWVPGFPFSERLNILTAGCLLALIAVPTIFTLAEDALQNVPKAFKEASFALGATRLQTIIRIIVPASLSGIISAVLLGLGRVIGETMVVLLCAGNRIAIPDFTAGLAVITQPVHTMTGIIAQEMGEVVQGSIHYRALFVVGLVLFFLSLTINFLAQKIVRKYRISIG